MLFIQISQIHILLMNSKKFTSEKSVCTNQNNINIVSNELKGRTFLFDVLKVFKHPQKSSFNQNRD